MQAQEQDIMTVKDVLQLLKISRNTLYKITKQGLLPCYRIEKAIRYRRADIEEYLKRQKT